MSLGYQPLVYMWVVEFTDGTSLPQFDPETGSENKADPEWLPGNPEVFRADIHTLDFDMKIRAPRSVERSEVFEHRTVKRFHWYPFSPELAEKIFAATGFIVKPLDLPIWSIDIPEGKKLIAKRENAIEYGMISKKVFGRSTIYCAGYTGNILRIKEDGTLEEGIDSGKQASTG